VADEAAATRVTEAKTLATTRTAEAKVLADGRVAAAKARADVDLKIAELRLEISQNGLAAGRQTEDNPLGLTPGQIQDAMAKSSVKFETLDKLIRENQKGDTAVIDDEMAILMAIIGETDITREYTQTEIRDFYRQIYNAEQRELGRDELGTAAFTRFNDEGNFHRGTYLEKTPSPSDPATTPTPEDDPGWGDNEWRGAEDAVTLIESTKTSLQPPTVAPPAMFQRGPDVVPQPQPRDTPSVASPVSRNPIADEPETEGQRAERMRANVPGGESLRAIPGQVAGTIGSILGRREGPRELAFAISRIPYDAQDHNGLSGLADYVKTHRDEFENANIDTEKYLEAIERKIILASNQGGPAGYVGSMSSLTGS
tara:strand:- start:457 stop:1566 length:1110 start_codon:yes stop_codon:yes gene_type:complete